jgi:hypothetical protein
MLSATGARALHGTGQKAGDGHGGAAIRRVPPDAARSAGTGRLIDRLRALGFHWEASAAAVDSAGRGPGLYLVATALLAALLIGALAAANYRLDPLRYSPVALARVAETLAGGSNYAVFDLNLDMRELRRQHIARLDATPEVVVLGAPATGRKRTPNSCRDAASTTPTSTGTTTRTFSR